MDPLVRLERWIEQMVEEPFVRLFAGQLLPQEVARRLVNALEDGERVGADGLPEVPGRYRIYLNPDDLSALLRHHPDLEAQLTEALEHLTERINLRTHEPPAVALAVDPRLPPRSVNIVAASRAFRSAGHTQDLEPSRVQQHLGAAPGTSISGPRAYLIIRGERTFDLNSEIVHIGRALDNDIILEDRQVSRYHAQLRRRYGRYILEDLGSSGGTTVNGFLIHEIVLRPGDLISLCGVDLIYVESEPLERADQGHTQPYNPVSEG